METTIAQQRDRIDALQRTLDVRVEELTTSNNALR